MSKGIRVTVIGATGLVGSYVLASLARAGRDVDVTAYARSSKPEPVASEVSWLPFPELDYFARAWQQSGMLDRMASVVSETLVPGDVFLSCLGTTRRHAGSAARFKFVDYAVNVAFAKAAKNGGYEAYGLVSSYGAKASSPFLYPQTKGALEDYVRGLGFERLRIYRPGLLEGERGAARFGESLFGTIAGAAKRVVPSLRIAPYMPIPAQTVAAAMTELVNEGNASEEVLSNRDMQRLTNYE